MRRPDELRPRHHPLLGLPRHAPHLPRGPHLRRRLRPPHVTGIEGTFLDAHYPRPVSGCAAEVSQRIAEAVFAALVPAIPLRVTAAPAGTSGNFALGGHDPERGRDYVMYQISGGGYGGNADHDGISNGCSTIGISKAPPVEIMEQQYPVLYRRYALHEGSAGAGTHRGGFGLDYEVELLRGTARASFVMDHGRFGPQGALGGQDGGQNRVEIIRNGETLIPEHLSKAQDIPLAPGDRVRVRTPGGGGYGPPAARDPAAVAEDVRLGRYTAADAGAFRAGWRRNGGESMSCIHATLTIAAALAAGLPAGRAAHTRSTA